MTDTLTDDIEIGTQVTTPFGIGVVSWVEIGGDEFQVLRYDRPHTDFITGGTTGSGPEYVTVDRAHIAHWPKRDSQWACNPCGIAESPLGSSTAFQRMFDHNQEVHAGDRIATRGSL